MLLITVQAVLFLTKMSFCPRVIIVYECVLAQYADVLRQLMAEYQVCLLCRLCV